MSDEHESPPPSATAPAAPARPLWLRLVPIIGLAGLVGALWALGVFDQLSLGNMLDWLAERRADLVAWRDANPVLAVGGYIVAYALGIAIIPPSALAMTLIGGFLFGPIWGPVWTVIGATLGAVLAFVVVRFALADWVARKSGPRLTKLRDGLQKDAFNYLLALRLIPAVPFFVINIAAGVFGVKLRDFALATFIGIIPGTTVYANIGSGLGAIIDQGGSPDLGIIFDPRVLAPLIGLGLLALLPVFVRVLRRNKATAGGQDA